MCVSLHIRMLFMSFLIIPFESYYPLCSALSFVRDWLCVFVHLVGQNSSLCITVLFMMVMLMLLLSLFMESSSLLSEGIYDELFDVIESMCPVTCSLS